MIATAAHTIIEQITIIAGTVTVWFINVDFVAGMVVIIQLVDMELFPLLGLSKELYICCDESLLINS